MVRGIRETLLSLFWIISRQTMVFSFPIVMGTEWLVTLSGQKRLCFVVRRVCPAWWMADPVRHSWACPLQLCVTACWWKGEGSAHQLATHIFVAPYGIKIWSYLFQSAYLKSEADRAVSLRPEKYWSPFCWPEAMLPCAWHLNIIPALARTLQATCSCLHFLYKDTEIRPLFSERVRIWTQIR